MQTSVAATPSPRLLSTPASAAGHRSSWTAASMQSGALGASYDSATASDSRRLQQQRNGVMSPQVRRAAVVPVQSRNATRIPSLGLSFDESHTQPNPPPAPPQSRKILSQSVSNPYESGSGSDRAKWSLGASVYCRFAVQMIPNCVAFASLTARGG